MLSDPLGAFHSIMDTAPPEDLAVMADPTWQKGFARALLESLGAGLDGWVDEAMALDGLWDVEPSSVPTSVTWYHAAEDRNCPVAAARRLVAQLPDARFVEWTDAGHLTAYHLEGEILDELLARG
jgi:pimeloyl-ACP methyl ester carboxylesterase